MKLDRDEVARFIATLGVAMVISGYLRYVIQGEFLTFSKVLLITGGVFLLAALLIGFAAVRRFFSRRSSQQGTNTIILSLAVLAILIVVNFVGFRHPKRFDLTTEKVNTLSDQTRQILTGMKKDVMVVRFDKTPDPQFDDLLVKYRNLNRQLKFQSVDPQQKPDVAEQYGATQPGEIIIAAGDRKEHITPASGEITEQDVTGALIKVLSDKVKTACFLTGHGEKSVTDNSEKGFSQAADGLKKENYISKTINLIAENGIAADCNAIVDAGPTQEFFPQEVEMIDKYLQAGGAALLLIDPATDPKLDATFRAWNVAVGNNVVVDASGVGRLLGGGPIMPVVGDFGASPITKGFSNSVAFFPLARTVSIADKAKSDLAMVELLKTSPRSFTIPSLKQGQKEIKYDPATDTLGPLSLGISAERKVEAKSARLVVIGNSQFASNPWISQQRNGDLFFNAVSWLAQDDSLISIRPKLATNRTVTLSEAQRSMLVLADLLFIPGLVFFSGIYIWWKRR